jgi:hypothetical protein
MPFSIYKQLEERIPSAAMLSNLRALRGVISMEDPIPEAILVLKAPNLRIISLNTPTSNFLHKVSKPPPTIA